MQMGHLHPKRLELLEQMAGRGLATLQFTEEGEPVAQVTEQGQRAMEEATPEEIVRKIEGAAQIRYGGGDVAKGDVDALIAVAQGDYSPYLPGEASHGQPLGASRVYCRREETNPDGKGSAVACSPHPFSPGTSYRAGTRGKGDWPSSRPTTKGTGPGP